MKKIIISLLIIVTIVLLVNTHPTTVLIPENAIRFRVIANSNDNKDQEIKKQVRDAIGKELYNKLLKTKSIYEAREVINSDLNRIDSVVNKTLQKNNTDTNYNINYGINHFPQKEYKGVTYKEGDYESLVITLGEGQGNNWWCVLFPPLCLLEAEQQQTDEVEYKSLIKELIDKYF